MTENALCGIANTDFIITKDIDEDSFPLTEGSKHINDIPNAGGSSGFSEVMSFEMLSRCFGAKLVKTEMEISYYPSGGAMTDFLCDVYGRHLGVSVTRAMSFKGNFCEKDALKLLSKKLQGVKISSKNTLDRWDKQILHIWASTNDSATVLHEAYEKVPSELKANTLVLVTTVSLL